MGGEGERERERERERRERANKNREPEKKKGEKEKRRREFFSLYVQRTVKINCTMCTCQELRCEVACTAKWLCSWPGSACPVPAGHSSQLCEVK